MEKTIMECKKDRILNPDEEMSMLLVSVSEHHEFYNGEKSYDKTLEPIPKKKGKNAPLHDQNDSDGDKITKK
jgi:hypothetical protein